MTTNLPINMSAVDQIDEFVYLAGRKLIVHVYIHTV